LKPFYDQLKGIKGSTVDLGIKPNAAQEKELKAIQDLINVKEQEINSYYDDLLAKDYTGGKASGSAADKYPIKKITPPT
jgi:C-terminal processing protease CtpA/Prc